MLTKHFNMKDKGIENVIFGIKISKTSNGIVLPKSHYIETRLRKFNKCEDSLVKTPVDVNLPLAKNIGQTISQLEYSHIIGSLMCVINYTRPNVRYAINILSRFTNNSEKYHWKAIIRILRHLRYTLNYGLHYTRYPTVLEGFSDANWIFNTNDTKSTSGYEKSMSSSVTPKDR